MTGNASHLGATLQDLLDERLDAARQTEVLTHLAGCPQCRSELEALRWRRDVALKKLPVEYVPPVLAAPSIGCVVAPVPCSYIAALRTGTSCARCTRDSLRTCLAATTCASTMASPSRCTAPGR